MTSYEEFVASEKVIQHLQSCIGGGNDSKLRDVFGNSEKQTEREEREESNMC